MKFTPIIFYLTVGGLIVFVLIMFIIGAGIKMFLYIVLGFVAIVAILGTITSFLEKILSPVWLGVLGSGAAVVVVQLFIQSWLCTLLMACLFGVLIFAHFGITNKKWSNVVSFLVYGAMIIVVLYFGV
ncbi:hypothetical protein ACW2QC_00260 [Virgibacillus sp. FSP13]